MILRLFASKIHKIKSLMPDAFIGVDVIVGTRGETEEYFEQAYRFYSKSGCDAASCVQLFRTSGVRRL